MTPELEKALIAYLESSTKRMNQIGELFDMAKPIINEIMEEYKRRDGEPLFSTQEPVVPESIKVEGMPVSTIHVSGNEIAKD